PCWCGGKHGEDKILAQCDRNVLALAERLKVHSLALPLLSRDRFEYPEELDLQIAEAPML
ncbi:MAG: macro domain-containing protein, partial [Oscillospiraceae bacterium]|nr:macro domain-containing protein [Oscillospiraceae bacterium]